MRAKTTCPRLGRRAGCEIQLAAEMTCAREAVHPRQELDHGAGVAKFFDDTLHDRPLPVLLDEPLPGIRRAQAEASLGEAGRLRWVEPGTSASLPTRTT